MSEFWWGFVSGIGAVFLACIVLGILIPLYMFATGKGAIH